MSSKINTLSMIDLEHFLREGYLIFTAKTLQNFSSEPIWNKYLDNISILQQKIRKFFALEKTNKARFKTLNSNFKAEKKLYNPGWWEASSYQDSIEQINFCLEYFISKNYFNSDEESMFINKNIPSDLLAQYQQFIPNKEVYQICSFLSMTVFDYFQKELKNLLNLNLPSYSLQIETAYYPDSALLNKHTDSSFLQAIIGPSEEGLFIVPLQSNQPIPLELKLGDVLLYSGREFKNILKSENLPDPLPHWVEAKKGRISILAGTFINSSC